LLSWFIDNVLEYFREPYSSWNAFLEAIGLGVRLFVGLDSKTAWLFLLSSASIAALVYAWEKRQGLIPKATKFREFLLPRSLVLHPSAKVEYKFVAIDLTFKSLTYGPLISGSSYLAYKITTGLRDALFPDASLWLAVPTSPLLVTVIVVLVADFGFFIGHYLVHKIPWLWLFHRVHHSAEVLTPITVYRTHPVDEMFGGIMSGVVAGVFATTYTTLTGEPVQLVTLFGVNVFTFAFFFVAYQLRHSHIWLSYGPLSWIFLSPAQHQIHHSKDPRHWDKNFGFFLSIWDWMFGCLYVPKQREKLEVGLADCYPGEFGSVWQIYVSPFGRLREYVKARPWVQALVRSSAASERQPEMISPTPAESRESSGARKI
jgi:sterol desaturase/sphingolipid hydroxylase (fatty acid hydroxylase superfamily)